MAVITIGGQIGAGINEVGGALAAKLGYEYHNRSAVRWMARILKTSPQAVWQKGLHVVSPSEFPGDSLNRANLWVRTGGPRGKLPPAVSFGTGHETFRRQWHEISDEEYVRALKLVHGSLASKDNIVLARKDGCVTIDGAVDALHVGLFASTEYRLQAYARQLHIDRSTAKHRLNVIGPRRRAAFRRFFGVDLRDPALYDLSIHVDQVGESEAVDLITSRINPENRVLWGSVEGRLSV